MLQRVAHGSTLRLDLTGDEEEYPPSSSMPFDYLFCSLQDQPAARLPEDKATVSALVALGESMPAPDNDQTPFSNIPSGYTYFGQFVDHDITFTQPRQATDSPASCDFTSQDFGVLPLESVLQNMTNKRKSMLQLEVLYNQPALRDGDRMRLGEVTRTVQTSADPAGKDQYHDVPRDTGSPDRPALIGDFRNDSNLIVSQMQVAFLRAHNALVDQKRTFAEAQTLLRQHYHWIIIDDFLKRIADPTIVDDILSRADPLYDLEALKFLPLEFTVAAYRFGHSMIRLLYYYNAELPGVLFNRLATLKQLKNGDKPTPTLPDNRVIQWERFVEGGKMSLNSARGIGTRLVTPLFKVFDERGNVVKCEPRLAVMDLLRGYMIRMPTGQAVARELIARGRNVRVLTPQEVIEAGANKPQKKALTDPAFANGTPLWFYILAEAAKLGKNSRLGPVGSTLVAEVLIGLIRHSPDSILAKAGSVPVTPSWSHMKTGTGEFKLRDLLQFAGVFDPNASS